MQLEVNTYLYIEKERKEKNIYKCIAQKKTIQKKTDISDYK